MQVLALFVCIRLLEQLQPEATATRADSEQVIEAFGVRTCEATHEYQPVRLLALPGLDYLQLLM